MSCSWRDTLSKVVTLVNQRRAARVHYDGTVLTEYQFYWPIELLLLEMK